MPTKTKQKKTDAAADEQEPTTDESAEEQEPSSQEAAGEDQQEQEDDEARRIHLVGLDVDELEKRVLGLEVRSEGIHLELSALPDDNQLLGNLLATATGLLDRIGGGDGLGQAVKDLPSTIGEKLQQLKEWLLRVVRRLLAKLAYLAAGALGSQQARKAAAAMSPDALKSAAKDLPPEKAKEAAKGLGPKQAKEAAKGLGPKQAKEAAKGLGPKKAKEAAKAS